MTESEWLSSANSNKMYESVRGHATTRQNQLLMAGCFRLIWDLLTDDRYQSFVQTLEAVAEDRASHEMYVDAVDELPRPAIFGRWFRPTGVLNFEELPSWCKTLDNAIQSALRREVGGVMLTTCSAAVLKFDENDEERFGAIGANHSIIHEMARLKQESLTEINRIQDLKYRGIGNSTDTIQLIEEREKQLEPQLEELRTKLRYEIERLQENERFRLINFQASLLRCIFGNPTRPIVIDRAWQTSTVLGIARGIRLDAAYDRMPILADALQDAGCEDRFILNHARHEAAHCRGCCLLEGIGTES
jgi:hypothetical protein